jgi:hypothetical protein
MPGSNHQKSNLTGQRFIKQSARSKKGGILKPQLKMLKTQGI